MSPAIAKVGKKNCRILIYPTIQILVSYTTQVAILVEKDNVIFITKTKYSNTTSRHISGFLRHCRNTDIEYVPQEILDKIIQKEVGALKNVYA